MKFQIKDIEMYIENKEIFTIKELKQDLQLEDTDENKLRIHLSRMCKNKKIYRYEKGVYGTCRYIDFLNRYTYPTEAKVINHIYLDNNNGYITGADYINLIGLSTWCPAKRTITSNQVTKHIHKYNTIIRKPKTKITDKNIKYLQLLDGIEEYKKYPIDCIDAEYCFYNQVKQLDTNYLIYLATKYYKKEILTILINIINKGVDYENTRK